MLHLHYQYRDHANFKTRATYPLTNANHIPLHEASTRIQAALISGEFFDPDQWQIPRIEEEFSTPWYEFLGLSEETIAHDPSHPELSEFLRRISAPT